jgi:ribosomal protein L4
LGNLKIDRSCLVVTGDYDETVYRSARNIPMVSVQPVAESNAGDICRHTKVLFTKEAFLSLMNKGKGGEN